MIQKKDKQIDPGMACNVSFSLVSMGVNEIER